MSYQAAGGLLLLLLLLLLIIISGSVEGIQPITTHRLTAPRQKTNACLAAILAHNSREAFALLKLVKPLRASYKLKPADGAQQS
ncbi:hypothetical protein AXF42_Ash021347 [Apostasia shenzhenica]|uniref:Uncharacterized protein n=1 Tax=Apostasia shenzhenica TaxID=1088818 RepID=A0A2H9ZZ06_9ASPA|nr:hypothetical protein AXF42_Ash021347 [Apostasia shenzhenica]